ncbi:MAG TPA: alanine dehydrogenase [Gammaproteobacteria bacterium]|nr:alanine dehydrogenase [Gammaproteobacteria bacterium]
MRVGVPKEIKNQEHRVGLTPAAVRTLSLRGHRVLVEASAGAGVGITDADYRAAGAEIVNCASGVYACADLVVKVKEPQPGECRLLRADQTLFAYLHLAAAPEQAGLLRDSGCTAIAYETVTDELGGLPLLAPMSEVAGRLSVQAAAVSLEKSNGGLGLLLAGVPGVPPAQVAVIGGGVVGTNAARLALGLGAEVTVLDRSLARMRELDQLFGPRLKTLYSNEEVVEWAALQADVVIGAVLIPGAAAPKLVSEAVVSQMKPGAVVVDVAIDQGGCFETSRPTTHDDPTYSWQGIVHYCVANMPGAVPRTSTQALVNATTPYVAALADKGTEQAIAEDRHLAAGVNVRAGEITLPGFG